MRLHCNTKWTQLPDLYWLLAVHEYRLDGNCRVKQTRGPAFQGAFMVIGILVQRDLRTRKLGTLREVLSLL